MIDMLGTKCYGSIEEHGKLFLGYNIQTNGEKTFGHSVNKVSAHLHMSVEP